jgi:hypothetical protein
MRQHRSLTPNERAVIERLLSVDFPEVEFFRKQIDAITVKSTCGCGCGTIRLSVDTGRAQRAPSEWWDGPFILVEGDSQSWLMLFQNDGWLSELEHVPGGPRPDELDPASIAPDPQVSTEEFG